MVVSSGTSESVDNDAERRAEQLFQQYFRVASKLDDLGSLAELLPVNAVTLHYLRGRCMGAMSKALKGGNHM